jgi:membrane associated rhomboid family serine protease
MHSLAWIIETGRIWANLPVWVMVGIWVGLQVLLAGEQMMGMTHVAALAHLGGAATGVFCWWLWRRSVGPDPVQQRPDGHDRHLQQ